MYFYILSSFIKINKKSSMTKFAKNDIKKKVSIVYKSLKINL